MCCHVINKTAYAEEVQLRAERMEPENNATNAKHDDNVSATSDPVKAVEKKDGSPSQSPSPQKSQKVDKTVQKHGSIVVDLPEKSPKEDIANTVPYDWYKLDEVKDKDRFINKVNRHASSLTLT